MLIGRETETAGLGELLNAARLGTSGALLLRGEAGIGKTALLEAAADAAEGFLVLRATGIESEAELPYSALHQLLRPLQDRIERLAEPQARALSGALGLAHEREADRFLVGAGTLTLLADAAEERPVLALLDDAAWFDHESGHALGFAARRLHAEGVVLLFAVRDEPDRPYALPGVPELRVERLAERFALELLRTRDGDGIDAGRRDDVVARAAGNPLALLELSSDGHGAGASGAEQAFAARVHALPEGTQELLLLAAADSTRSLAVVGEAARELGLDATALAPAETAGLVHAAHGTIEFRHPLVRSAAYHSAPFAARARAHLALAAVVRGDEDADHRAWHRAAAVLGTDDEVAGDLERTADRAHARGGHAAASAALERAGRLSADPAARARRLVAAADAAAMAGERQRALALLDRAGALSDPASAALAALIRGRIAMHRSSSRDAFESFMQALAAGHEAVPAVAQQAAIGAIEALAQGRVWDRLDELRALTGTIQAGTAPEERAALAVARGFIAFVAGDFDAAFPELHAGVELSADSADPITLMQGAWAAAFTSDLVQPSLLATRAERAARATGTLGALSGILATRATWDLSAARFAVAESSATESLALARETGQEGLAAVNLALLAHVDAVRGHEASCRARAAEAIALGEERDNCHPVSAAGLALGVLELGLRAPGRGAGAAAADLRHRPLDVPLHGGRRPDRGRRARRPARRRARRTRAPGSAGPATRGSSSAMSFSPAHGRCSRRRTTPTSASGSASPCSSGCRGRSCTRGTRAGLRRVASPRAPQDRGADAAARGASSGSSRSAPRRRPSALPPSCALRGRRRASATRARSISSRRRSCRSRDWWRRAGATARSPAACS